MYVAPKGQVAPADFTFAALSGVKRVNLVVLSSNVGLFTRIEIREVAFLSPVPEAGTLSLFVGGMVCMAMIRRRRTASSAA
jgi:hypothetical protein